MTLPLLTLPDESVPPYRGLFASWNRTLHRMLAESGVFAVRTATDLPVLPRRSAGRVTGNFSVVRVGNVMVGIDSWDTVAPTSSAFDAGKFTDDLLRIKLLLKIQWQPDPYWDKFTATTGIKVSPWTIFPTREFPLGFFRWEHAARHIYTGTLTGVARFGRGDYTRAVRDQHDYYMTSNGGKDPMDVYLNVLRTCRWGVSLKGKRGTDGKNRREIEYASCGMPLALNYEPHYPFRFVAGEHYVLLREPADLLKLRDVDPRPFAAMSDLVYRDYWSAPGMARMLLKLVESL